MTLRVLHIWGPDFKYDFGGHYIFWKSAYEKWDDNSIQHLILDYEYNMIKDAKELIRENRYESNKSSNRLQRLLWAFKLCGKILICRNDYDILNVHMLLWGGLLIGPLSKIIRKPAIYESILEGADNPSAIKKNKLGKIQLWCLKKFSKILAISSALTDDYRSFGFTVVKNPNPVDSSIFSPLDSISDKLNLRKSLRIPISSKVLLFVGSIIERKGVDIIIKVFIELSETYKNLFLILVGPKSTNENRKINVDYINEIYMELNSKHLLSRVMFTGLIDDKHILSNYYQLSDIFIFPSRNEGLGNVILEAASSKLPIIVSRLSEFEDIIQDKKTGLFVSKDDIQGFKSATNLLLNDFCLSQTIAKNARDHVVKNFSFNEWQSTLVKCFYEIYNKNQI